MGRRVNMERLERQAADLSENTSRMCCSRAIPGSAAWKSAPYSTAAAYTLDWSDTGECHDHTGVHRTSGRIYRFSYGEPAKPVPLPI